MSREHRLNPESEENAAMTRDNERATFAAQQQAKPRCPECGADLFWNGDRDWDGNVGSPQWLECEECGHKEP